MGEAILHQALHNRVISMCTTEVDVNPLPQESILNTLQQRIAIYYYL